MGWGQSANTWVAECRGRRFICTETINAGPSITSYGSNNTHVSASGGHTTETHCAPEVASPEEPSTPAATPTPVAVAKEQPPAPRGGAGFTFGAPAADAQTTCENAQQNWSALSEKAFLCSASPVDLGFSAEAVVHICQNAVCGVTVVHRPNSGWLKTYRELKEQLESKYGESEAQPVELPKSCRSDSTIVECINNESVRVRNTWKWPTGERIHLLLSKDKDTQREPGVRIQYVKPLAAINPKTDAL